VQSTIGGEDPEWQGAWNEEQHDASNPDSWKAHIDAVGADYSDSAHNAGPVTPNESPSAWESSYAQRRRQIYPVEDSDSYIAPYSQRNHSWNDYQFDHSDEVTWSAHTNATAAGYTDHVTNEMSLDSRLNYGDPTAQTDGGSLAQRRAKRFTQYVPVQSTIGGEDPEWQGAWNEEQHDASHYDSWKAHIDAVGADYSDSAFTAPLVPPSQLA